MGAGKDGFKIETKPMLKEKKRGDKPSLAKTLLVSMEPKDRFRIVYWIMVLQGVGTLLPWNMFITAHAYFQEKLEKNKSLKHDFENYFAVAAMVPNVLMFLLNTLFKHKVRLQVRMLTSLITMTALFVLTTALVKVDTFSWTNNFFYITIVTVIVVNMMSAVFQGGLFGLTGMMPFKYTGAVMTGQGIGGTFAALANIAALFGGKDAISSGFGYFFSAVVVLFICLISYILLPQLEFARYYMEKPEEQTEIDARNIQEQSKRLANWKLDTEKGRFQSTLSLDAKTLINVESTDGKEVHIRTSQRPPFLKIFKQIAPLGLSVAFVFFVTLASFPGLTSRIKSKSTAKNEWTEKYFIPVSCFLLFNVGDFIGRIIASIFQLPRGSKLLPILCFVRVVFIPLFFFCNAQPRGENVPVLFNDDTYFIVFMLLFGISNGYLGSLCMMYGPGLVEKKDSETAGTMMAFLLIVGLGLGAAFSFVVSALLKL
ncbi:equilibrative nucleoside transporter 1-like isoform X2 [Actinia tenebrosa]|uniref:Equilibrative nucleoside transporter 1-like isoform X2 n=1 Tax=Actinia tenebrosa TaxID=6105 RepID=A0A6P8HYU5_ACTTE|nr:equilibrative nucleoside transporter 1-like isoform X2 [Actinia tenebrosa]